MGAKLPHFRNLPANWTQEIYYGQFNGMMAQGQFYMVSRGVIDCMMTRMKFTCIHNCPGEDWLFGTNVLEGWYERKVCPRPWYIDPYRNRIDIGCACKAGKGCPCQTQRICGSESAPRSVRKKKTSGSGG